MRRLLPTAELALPPISPVAITHSTQAVGCWTVRERRPPVQTHVKTSPKGGKRALSSDARVAGRDTNAYPQDSGERFIPGGQPPGTTTAEQIIFMERSALVGEPFSPRNKSTGQAMKGRAIENWLNARLGAANIKPKAEMTGVAGGAANKMQGLSEFGVDAASLERLGLDTESADRVYRAMFVYSHGLHAVLQEAAGKSKSSSQALLVLWRAFTTVLEDAGQSEEQGAESLSSLVQRGNEEEMEKIEEKARVEKTSLQMQNQKLSTDRREMQVEVQRLREDEIRLRNDNEMHRHENQVAMSKYEREIKQRVDAEVRFMSKCHWADALQEDLNKERKKSLHSSMQLQEANTSREAVQVEVDLLRTQVKMQEAQAGAYKQGALEAAQQKQRHEQQVFSNQQNLERQLQKNAELKVQFEQEVEQNKQLVEQSSKQHRENRKLETQFEDESHLRNELQNERDGLRERLDKMDREISELIDERRAMQKETNDLSLKHRTDQIELKRYAEQLERAEKSLEKIQDAHRKLVDASRSSKVEVEYLREDCKHFEEQLKKESEMRKLLQHEKKQLTGQLQTAKTESDTSHRSLQGAMKELQDVTENMVKLESIVRDTKASMQKVTLEHQVEIKAHTQKVSILERVIADERNERRHLVAESQSLVEKREAALDLVQKKDLEIADLKRFRLEREEEVDRFRILLKAQEQRNSEQLVTVDKYHAAVANHDAEMRQMHVLLECEREEAQRKLSELQAAYASTRHTSEQRIEGWKLSFEDVLSRLNFNPATHTIETLELENFDMKKELKEAQAFISAESKKVKSREALITKRDDQIQGLREDLKLVKAELEEVKIRCSEYMVHAERQAFARCDAEHRTERIKQNTEAFDDMKASLEANIREGREEIERLQERLTIPKADAETQVFFSTSEMITQTDLSYQYLESSERLQNEPGRLQRMDALKRASHLIESTEKESTEKGTQERPDVSVGTPKQCSAQGSNAQDTAGQSVGVIAMNLNFEEGRDARSGLVYRPRKSSGRSSVPAHPRAAEPWPPSGCAPAAATSVRVSHS